MVRKEILQKRLQKLEEYLDILERSRSYSYDEFICDPERYGSAERFLHLAIEALNDIGNHIVADLKLGAVNWLSEIPQRLFEHGYITDDMKQTWIRMIGFRNALVHDYTEIDHSIVHDVLQKNLGDIRRLMGALAQFL